MEMKDIINDLDRQVPDPAAGLPDELFLLFSRMTPLVNVDLLIRNEKGQTLLTWRDDGFWAPGWHVPGGVIRYKETFAERIREVAQGELGVQVEFDNKPLAVKECIIEDRRDRGHFVSFLYQCRLLTPLDQARRCQDMNSPCPEEWEWFSGCPDNIIEVHEMYRRYI